MGCRLGGRERNGACRNGRRAPARCFASPVGTCHRVRRVVGRRRELRDVCEARDAAALSAIAELFSPSRGPAFAADLDPGPRFHRDLRLRGSRGSGRGSDGVPLGGRRDLARDRRDRDRFAPAIRARAGRPHVRVVVLARSRSQRPPMLRPVDVHCRRHPDRTVGQCADRRSRSHDRVSKPRQSPQPRTRSDAVVDGRTSRRSAVIQLVDRGARQPDADPSLGGGTRRTLACDELRPMAHERRRGRKWRILFVFVSFVPLVVVLAALNAGWAPHRLRPVAAFLSLVAASGAAVMFGSRAARLRALRLAQAPVPRNVLLTVPWWLRAPSGDAAVYCAALLGSPPGWIRISRRRGRLPLGRSCGHLLPVFLLGRTARAHVRNCGAAAPLPSVRSSPPLE